jgi:hypothetical protein
VDIPTILSDANVSSKEFEFWICDDHNFLRFLLGTAGRLLVFFCSTNEKPKEPFIRSHRPFRFLDPISSLSSHQQLVEQKLLLVYKYNVCH